MDTSVNPTGKEYQVVTTIIKSLRERAGILLTVEEVEEILADSDSNKVFLIPHLDWVSAGFSAVSRPRKLLLSYDEPFTGILENEIDLHQTTAGQGLMQHFSTDHVHYATNVSDAPTSFISRESQLVSVCGFGSKVSINFKDVTCPYCKQEIYHRTSKISGTVN